MPQKRRTVSPHGVAAYHRRYNQENKKRLLAQKRVWRASGPERKRATERRNYAVNHEEIAAMGHERRPAPPEKALAITQRRRARKLGGGMFVVTDKELRAMKSKPCYICNSAPSVHIEHIIPVCKGGRWSVGNLAGACAGCNHGKNSMYLIEYRHRNSIRRAA